MRPTVSRLVRLGVGPPSGTHDQMFITLGHLQSSCCWAPFLARGRVCNLLMQLSVTLRSKYRRTHDYILLSHLRLLGALFVVHFPWGVLSQSKGQSYITTDGQSASLSWCQAPIWDSRPFFLLPLIIFRQLRIC
jgi:hypothetical protein